MSLSTAARAACWVAVGQAVLTALCVTGAARAATIEPTHLETRGPSIEAAEVRGEGGRWQPEGWRDLAITPIEPGRYEVRIHADANAAGDAVEIPPCAGRGRILIDGRPIRAASAGPVVVALAQGEHEVRVAVDVSRYERRIACGAPLRVGPPASTIEGLGSIAFDSPHARRGGGRAVLFVPAGHDVRRPGPLLVGLHPWNGTIWTYAAYGELLREAERRDVVLLMPSGLGNSLYTADAEDEVLRAIDAAEAVVAVDPSAVSIWGASMGGAGATTIGLHHPDRFASVTSFFGDSSYDLSTYVRAILPDAAAARRVDALAVVDNARHVPVWLVHGEDDAVSPIRQSEILAAAMSERGYPVRFDRVAGMGHAGALVARYAAQVVDVAASARAPRSVARVTYRSVRPSDVGAYGVGVVRAGAGEDAFVDVERRADGVHVRAAEGVRAIVLARGALGTAPQDPPPIVFDGARPVPARWEPPAP